MEGGTMSHKRTSKIVTPKDEWQTPQWLFDLLDNEFHFDCDAAARSYNTKCPIFFNDALSHDWMDFPPFSTRTGSNIGEDGPGHLLKVFFLNCPYSAALINAFMKKAYEESQKDAVVVCLVPVSGDKWWIDYALKAQEIRYIRGRVKFVGFDIEGNQVNGSPMFSSCIVIFDRSRYRVSNEPGHIIMDKPWIGPTIEQPKRTR